MSDHDALLHETELFKAFLVRPKRDRFLSLLETKQGRDKIRTELAHFNPDLFVGAVQITPHQQNPSAIEEMLRLAGSPELIYVISENRQIDRKFANLGSTVDAVVGRGLGSFISCLPGKLAYFEGEEINTRCLLRK